MTAERLELILEQHDVHPQFWGEMKALVFDGVRPREELRLRLKHVQNFKDALDTIMAELSKQVHYKFPPAEYESLEIPA